MFRFYRVYKPYLWLALALVVILLIPQTGAQRLRSEVVSWFSPLWYTSKGGNEEMQRVLLENRLLKEDIERLRDLLHQELSLESDLVQLEALSLEFRDKDAFFQRRYEELLHHIELKLRAVPAEIVRRDMASWNSTVWVDVGSSTNERLGWPVVEKNSPVVKDGSVVGVVDYVGKNHSLVRLITDPSLHPSVRVARGYAQDRELMYHVDALLRTLSLRQEHEVLSHNLMVFKKNLNNEVKGALLAKGELCGKGSATSTLRGVGFNYDYADAEGESRDLRRGALIQVGDLLVTTGMDGVFPPGLPVAEVSSIEVLKEGSSSLEIEAIALVHRLDDLHRVFILPSVKIDEN